MSEIGLLKSKNFITLIISNTYLFSFRIYTLAKGIEWSNSVDVSSEYPIEWVFKRVDDKELKMSVSLPDNYADSEMEFPCILFFQGGSWKGENHR